MKKAVPLLLLLAIVLSILGAVSTASAAPDNAQRASGEKTERVLKPTSKTRSITSQGRVVGKDGRGIRVFKQFRKCGEGKWKNMTRETTTARGRYDFDVAGKPALMRKYKYREYKVKFYNSNQFRLFIPATDKYKPVSILSEYCLG